MIILNVHKLCAFSYIFVKIIRVKHNTKRIKFRNYELTTFTLIKSNFIIISSLNIIFDLNFVYPHSILRELIVSRKPDFQGTLFLLLKLLLNNDT